MPVLTAPELVTVDAEAKTVAPTCVVSQTADRSDGKRSTVRCVIGRVTVEVDHNERNPDGSDGKLRTAAEIAALVKATLQQQSR